MKLFATCAFGLESIVEKELRKAAIWTIGKSDGRVNFEGDQRALYLSNLILRSADRVYLDLGNFPASDFDQLFEGVFAIPWSNFLPINARIVIAPGSVKSQLYGLPTIQSISQKAIFKKLAAHYQQNYFEQSGETFEISIKIQNDQVFVGLNASGESLHKRGYRQQQLQAPLKETMAAGILQIAELEKYDFLIDPFCGSGTFGIEAAMIDQQIAPGLNRNFAFTSWPDFDHDQYQSIRSELLQKIQKPRLTILCSDHDPQAITIAKNNANHADCNQIRFQKLDFHNIIVPANQQVLLICNPPYGERLSEAEEADQIIRDLGEIAQKYPNLTIGILTPSDNFSSLFGKPSSLNRKLYNGKIKCYFHLIKATNESNN